MGNGIPIELINNVTRTLKDDLSAEIKEGSKLSVAAACFSIYAFQELRAELQNIDELRFVFTSPTFTTEKARKEKREFYIPRLNRERSLYGTEFEVKLRNELNQKATIKAEDSMKKQNKKSKTADKTKEKKKTDELNKKNTVTFKVKKTNPRNTKRK